MVVRRMSSISSVSSCRSSMVPMQRRGIGSAVKNSTVRHDKIILFDMAKTSETTTPASASASCFPFEAGPTTSLTTSTSVAPIPVVYLLYLHLQSLIIVTEYYRLH